MQQAYELADLAKALKFTPAYVRMVLRKFEDYQDGKPVSAELAQKVAEKLSRPWPPAEQA
ncbi:MAG: hypothetical protein GXY23_06405 [Myxococcales bacterium]|jgi:hypothetical protein|nr:hypothetical protein [Myxococcales bacterium]